MRVMWLGVLLAFASCGGGGSDAMCIPGQSVACACTNGMSGAQVCLADHTFGVCMCTGGIDAATGTADAARPDAGGLLGTCGNGICEAYECTGPFACPGDCVGMCGAPDAGTSGHVYYAGMTAPAGPIWSMLPLNAGMTGLAAGNNECLFEVPGSDHVCDYEEVRSAAAGGEALFATIPAGTNAWVQRTTTALVGGTSSPAGAGGRCDDWMYFGNTIAEGEYVSFDTMGVPTYHLDDDTIFDGTTTHTNPSSTLPCTAMRTILCCYH
jgi:hypothetical protein